jgi:hypothetical protein
MHVHLQATTDKAACGCHEGRHVLVDQISAVVYLPVEPLACEWI